MTLQEKALSLICVVLVLALGLGVLLHAHSVQSYQKQLDDLQNQVASSAKTIEIQKGVYEKQSMTESALREMLDSKNAQASALQKQLNKTGEQLLSANEVAVGLRQQIAQMGQQTTQTDVPASSGNPERTKVDFHGDFGLVKVDGWTMTNPAQSWIRLSPGQPLVLTLAVSQGKDKVWHTYATNSDERYAVDIHLAAVNPYVLQPKWYEGLGISTGLGMGSNQSGLGVLVELGINYKLKQFTFGPAVWLGINNVVDKYYGLTFEWRPFEQVH